MNIFHSIITRFKEAADKQTELDTSFSKIVNTDSFSKFINKSETSELIYGAALKYNWNRYNRAGFEVIIQDFNVDKFVEDNLILSITEHSHELRVSFVGKTPNNRYTTIGCLSFNFEEDSELILMVGVGGETSFKLNETILNIKSLLTEKVRNNKYHINILISNEMGLSFRRRALKTAPLITENYNPEVVNKINYSINNLKSENPKGKIIICEGPPGTGKSYAIRHIIKQTEEDVETVLIPVNMVSRLTGPDLMETLFTHHRGGKRFCFIIEDADKVISSDDNQEISEILNFGDGIMGETLDSRLILTTNLKKTNINRALTRPGRLCSYIEFKNLEPNQASIVYKNLTGQSKNYTEAISLAEIYRNAQTEDTENLIKINTSRTGQYL